LNNQIVGYFIFLLNNFFFFLIITAASEITNSDVVHLPCCHVTYGVRYIPSPPFTNPLMWLHGIRVLFNCFMNTMNSDYE